MKSTNPDHQTTFNALSRLYALTPSLFYAPTLLALSHWIVPKSTNCGNSWTTVDNSLSAVGYGPDPAGVSFVADSNGNLFVGGWSVF